MLFGITSILQVIQAINGNRVMCMRLIFTVLSLCLALSPACAERLKVHPTEQAAIDSIVRKIGADEKYMTIRSGWYPYQEYYEGIEVGTQYFYKPSSDRNERLHVVTDINGHVSVLVVSNFKADIFEEIRQFKNLVFLSISESGIESVGDISSLKNLEFFKLSLNDNLVELGGIRNLPNLKFMYVGSGDKVKSIDGMDNLPKLEEFHCESCMITDISPLATAKNLKVLKIGMLGKTLDPLKNSTKMEEIKIRSETLTDASALNNMEELEKIYFGRANIEQIDIGPNLSSLMELYVINTPLKKVPDVSQLKMLKELVIAGTDIGDVSTIKDLPKLELLTLIRNKNIRKITNLKNLPSLKELKLGNQPLEHYETGVLPSLKELDLSRTNLEKLTGFQNFPKLTHLKLYETKVNSVRGIEKAERLEYVQTDHTLPDSAENDAMFQEMKDNRMRRLRERFGKYLD